MAERRLEVFRELARCGSFTMAAARLHMTQPAVSFQIKQFERELGLLLVERGSRGLKLTPAGKLVLDYAERIISLDEEMHTRVSSLAGGEVVDPA